MFLNTTKEWLPHPYQEKSVELIVRQSASGLLLDPGLGKTSCVLSALKILISKGYIERALIIAPLRPMYHVWTEEISKWSNFSGLKYKILHGKNKDDIAQDPGDVDILLINPHGLPWLFKKYGKNAPKTLGVQMLVVDESTMFKHSRTARFKILKQMLPQFERRYILTGTMTPNGLMDLFGQIYILDGGNALGRYITHYRNGYFIQPNPMHEPYRWEAKQGAMEEISEKISPLTLRLKAEDYLEMPSQQFINLEVELPNKAKETYKQVEDDFLSAIEDTFVVAENSAVAGTKCRQIANGAVYTVDKEYRVVHDAKIDMLEELVEELSGDPLLVMYEYKHDMERILAKYPDTPCLGSGTSASKSTVAIKRFNAGELPILLGHPASMGHGLNLQGSCNKICWFGITWNFEYYDQAIARIYRQGQESPTVFVYHIVAKNTLDKNVLNVLLDKERSQEKLLQSLRAPI